MHPKKKKGQRWKRINQKILSELDYLAEFQTAVETSFAAASIIAENVAAGVLPDKQAAIRESVERALLRAAPSSAVEIARQAVIEVLGPEAAIPEITIGLEGNSLIGGTIESRAEMYTDSTYATFENNVLAREIDEGGGEIRGRRVLEDGDNCEDCIAASTEEFVPLSELPEIGDSVCQSRCRCEFEFEGDEGSFRTSELFGGTIRGQEAFGGDVEVS